MVPKKTKDLYKQLAEEQNLSEALVQDVVEYYYKAVKQNMIGIAHPRIDVSGLGQFIVKISTVERGIEKTEKVLKVQDESTFRGYHFKKVLEERLVLLKNIQQKMLAVKEERKKFREKKNESSIKSNLGKQD
jgi:nucleoid DNA-binding protein